MRSGLKVVLLGLVKSDRRGLRENDATDIYPDGFIKEVLEQILVTVVFIEGNMVVVGRNAN